MIMAFYDIYQRMYIKLFLIPLWDVSQKELTYKLNRGMDIVLSQLFKDLMKTGNSDLFNEYRMVAQCHRKDIEKLSNALETIDGYQILKSILRHYKMSHRPELFYHMKYNINAKKK